MKVFCFSLLRISTFAYVSFPMKRQPDTEIIQMINSCPNLKILHLENIKEYLSENTFDNISPVILTNLTNLSVGRMHVMDCPNNISTISKKCQNLQKLTIKMPCDVKILKNLISNNANLVELSLCLVKSTFYIPCAEFIYFLITTSNSYKVLIITGDKIKPDDLNGTKSMQLFCTKFKASLAELDVFEHFSLKTHNNQRKLTVSEFHIFKVENFGLMIQVIPNINIIEFGFLRGRDIAIAHVIIKHYCETLQIVQYKK